MASNTKIGEVTKYDLITEDNLGNIYYSYLNKNGLKINPDATYKNVNTASRALAAISTNIYNNTYLTTNIKITNSDKTLGDVQKLFITSQDSQENEYQTLLNVGDTRVNPDVQQAHVQIYILNSFRNLSTNTLKSIDTTTIVGVNEQMAG